MAGRLAGLATGPEFTSQVLAGSHVEAPQPAEPAQVRQAAVGQLLAAAQAEVAQQGQVAQHRQARLCRGGRQTSINLRPNAAAVQMVVVESPWQRHCCTNAT